MTITDALDILAKEISEATEKIQAKNEGGALEIRKNVSYSNNHFDFTDEQKRDSTFLYYGILVGPPDFAEEDALEFSISASIIKRVAIKPEELEEQIDSFRERVAKFCEELSNAEDIPALIEEKVNAQNAETDEAIAKLEEDLQRQYKKIRNISLIVCGIIIAMYILIAFLTK